MPQRLPRLVVAVAMLAAGCGGSSDGPAPPSGARSSSASDVVERVSAPGSPIGLAVAPDGEVLVALADEGSIARISLERGEVVATTPVGAIPLRVAADGREAWVAAFGASGVVRLVDGRPTDRWGRVATEPEGLALSAGSLWVVDQAADEVVEVDPRSGAVRRRVPVGSGPRLVSAGRGGVWVSSYVDGSITRVDDRGPSTSDYLCGGPQGLAEAGAQVWVACTATDAVVAVDAATLRPRREVDLEGAPDAIVADAGGGVLVALQEGPSLVRLDADGHETGRCTLGQAPPVGDGNIDVVLAERDGEPVAVVSSPEDDAVLVLPIAALDAGCTTADQAQASMASTSTS